MNRRTINTRWRNLESRYIVDSVSNCRSVMIDMQEIDVRPGCILSEKEMDLLLRAAGSDGSTLTVNIK